MGLNNKIVIFSNDMKSIILIISTLLSLPAWAGVAGETALGPAFWATPRSAESVAANEPLAQLVRALGRDPEAQLRLSYPSGEWGELWGQELKAWLIALGVSVDRLELTAVGEMDEGVSVELIVPAAVEETGAAAVAEAVTVAPEADEAEPRAGDSSMPAVEDDVVEQEQE